MQSVSDNTNTNNMQTWTEQEIKELILYAKGLQEEVHTKNAQLIMMNAKLENEEKKVTRLNNVIKLIYGQGNNIIYPN